MYIITLSLIKYINSNNIILNFKKYRIKESFSKGVNKNMKR